MPFPISRDGNRPAHNETRMSYVCQPVKLLTHAGQSSVRAKALLSENQSQIGAAGLYFGMVADIKPERCRALNVSPVVWLGGGMAEPSVSPPAARAGAARGGISLYLITFAKKAGWPFVRHRTDGTPSGVHEG